LRFWSSFLGSSFFSFSLLQIIDCVNDYFSTAAEEEEEEEARRAAGGLTMGNGTWSPSERVP